MGNPNSKVAFAQKQTNPDEGSLPSTPILTPKVKIIENDPRSPSANIVRTPIQNVISVDKIITPIIGIIESHDEDNPMINIDPRSPSVEFIRTPIVSGNQPLKLKNKNLENVKQMITYTPPKRFDESLNNSVKGPKLIEVNSVIKKLEHIEKRKSYVGLLETDLDFVETDLDKVAKQNEVQNEEKLITATITPEIIEENQENKIDEEELVEKVSKFDNSKIEIEEHIEELDNEDIEIEDVKEENNEKTETHENKNLSIFNREEIISPIKETLEKICQMDKEIKEAIANSYRPVALINDEIGSNEFDKKVTNLIYEDDDILNLIKPIKQKNENRTPLSERNINHTKKSSNKLKVHDKPRKKDYTVSKIPVFKEKKGKSKIILQCENTPPRQMPLEIKSRKAQWDAEKTLII